MEWTATGAAVPCVLCSLWGLVTGEGTVEILVFVCSSLREKFPLSAGNWLDEFPQACLAEAS